jgi:hypothetical protein
MQFQIHHEMVLNDDVNQVQIKQSSGSCIPKCFYGTNISFLLREVFRCLICCAVLTRMWACVCFKFAVAFPDFVYTRCVGRYTQPPADLWDWYDAYLEDPEVRNAACPIPTHSNLVCFFSNLNYDAC